MENNAEGKVDLKRIAETKERDTEAVRAPAGELLRNEDLRPSRKQTITIRLDADVLDWFRRQGRGYQTRINKLLRSYMEAHRE